MGEMRWSDRLWFLWQRVVCVARGHRWVTEVGGMPLMVRSCWRCGDVHPDELEGGE